MIEILFFLCMESVIKGRYHLRLVLLVRFGQLSISSNEIVGFFDHQFFWKEAIDILVFCMDLVIKGR